MARQDGIFKLTGELGDISFYKTQDGHLAKTKGGVDGDRIKNDPAFVRTRENNAEFARAGSGSKLLRTALRSRIMTVSDSRMSSRLTQLMTKVIQADVTSVRGLRNVVDGEASLLSGFEFNQNGKLDKTFFAPYTTVIDRVTGDLTISIPEFISAQMIAAPQGATHFRLVSAGAEIDFENNSYVVTNSNSADIELTSAAQPALSLTQAVTPASTKPLFLVFGIEFYQQVNGVLYQLSNGAYNALAIVAVDTGV